MRFAYFWTIALTLFSAGCNVQTGLAPTEDVIAKSADRDFGFAGNWAPVPNAELPHIVDSYHITIERGDSYSATLSGEVGKAAFEFDIRFQAVEIAEEHPHAIVEIELLKDGEMIPKRRLAIAAVTEEQLRLWMIDGKKIAEYLYDDGQNAVVEHFRFSTKVRCKPQQLLETIRNHSAELVGDVQVFQRVP